MSSQSAFTLNDAKAIQNTPAFLDDLADLQSSSLRIIAVVAGVIGYVPFVLSPFIHNLVRTGFWIGMALLGVISIISFLVASRHSGVARHLLVWGILVATILNVRSFESPALSVLLVVPIILASTLLGQHAVFSIATIEGLVTVIPGLLREDASVISAETTLLLGVIALSTFASWLSARNLHIALAWYQCGYERARRSEEMAREKAGELQRTLKALDEATHRLERANRMLAFARDQAEDARQLKQRFAQTVSHELRTPLNIILGFIELMTESPEYYGAHLPLGYQRDLNIVHRNARHLQNLVNDVLDLARIDAAQMSIQTEEVDPATIVCQATRTARSLVEARGLELRVEIEPGLPPVRVDPTRIRQVLINLLNNAARFTKQGSISISVCRKEKEIVFSVTDTGVGISPKDIPHIFEEFRQADGSTRRQHDGAGLGLAISKRFVQLHGGEIGVQSTVGEGSVFSFSLPMDQSDLGHHLDGSLMETMRTVPDKIGERPILLAVTSNLAAAAMLTHYMRDCETLVVCDLQQAKETVRTVLPRAMLVDSACVNLSLPKLTQTACEWGLRYMPIIQCPLPREKRLDQHLGVEGYLVKPVSGRTLLDALRRFGEDVDTVLIVDDDLDFVRLVSRVLEDNPIRRYKVIGAHSGQEGLDLVELHRPDLILLDLKLPDLDGFQVVERLRANLAWQDIPVIIVSAQDSLDDQASLNGVLTITKPEGLMLAETMQWARAVIDAVVTSPLMPVGPRAEIAL